MERSHQPPGFDWEKPPFGHPLPLKAYQQRFYRHRDAGTFKSGPIKFRKERPAVIKLAFQVLNLMWRN